MIGWITSRIGAAVAALGAVLALIAGAFLRGRSKGRQDAAQKGRMADHERASKVRERADDADRVSGRDDAVERLRKLGRLRPDE